MKAEQENHPIYNGRPFGLTGSPITIYNEAFATVKETLRNISVLSYDPKTVATVARLFSFSSEIYTIEADRAAAVFPVLNELLGVTLEHEFQDATNRSSAVAREGLGYVLYVDVKVELGIGGSGDLQGPLTLRKLNADANVCFHLIFDPVLTDTQLAR